MGKHMNGKKRGGRHTTCIDAAIPVVKFAEKLPEVTKISPGFIKSGIRGGRQRIKLKDIVGGVRLIIRGSTCVQEVKVYSQNPGTTKMAFIKYFPEITVE